MKYVQLNAEERSAIATLKRLGWSVLEMARELGRQRSTVARELRRNATPHDGWYRAGRAHERAVARRRRSRRNRHFGKEELRRVETLLREEWSPSQDCRGRFARQPFSTFYYRRYRRLLERNHLSMRQVCHSRLRTMRELSLTFIR